MSVIKRNFGRYRAYIDEDQETILLVELVPRHSGGVSPEKVKSWALRSLQSDYRGFELLDATNGHNLRNGDSLPEMREVSRNN
jgi:hypothetical protein